MPVRHSDKKQPKTRKQTQDAQSNKSSSNNEESIENMRSEEIHPASIRIQDQDCKDNESVTSVELDQVASLLRQLRDTQLKLAAETDRRRELEFRQQDERRQNVNNQDNHLHVNQSPKSTNTFVNHNNKAIAKPAKPDHFCGGKDDNALVWINEIKRYLKLTNTPSDLYVETAASYLKKNAQVWYTGYLTSNEVREGDLEWDEFRESFIKRYAPSRATANAHSRLVSWRQTGSIEAYIDGFSNLSAQVPYNVVSELGRVNYFVNGLKSHIKRLVMTMKPSNLQEAFESARESADTFRDDSDSARNTREYQHPKMVRRTVPDSTQLNNVSLECNQEETEQNTNCEGDSNDNELWLLNQLDAQRRMLLKEGRCFSCGQKGHRVKDCAKRKSNFKQKFHQNLN